MKNYRRDCLYYFSIDGMCGRLLKSHDKVVPCDHICDCPWFKPIPMSDCIYVAEGGLCAKALPGVECDMTKCVCYTKK